LSEELPNSGHIESKESQDRREKEGAEQRRARRLLFTIAE
jgi:hypothetical protein